ncbi:polysaccharide biosynthesis/export family protein [Prevotella sp. E9-3]|uniref:polysaccharide biosynthesis/export family protein n=1 Tax=Prevotella sp. E9-3 TaxID=2913621 RepID=UPI001EDC2E66|nr:polysaccharide biosynthesis/export family protein [Prevotella sp. E9-3]UKK47615.1 polysaccharide biosynthesis/export family protein [Prevotella sp. E9-3]
MKINKALMKYCVFIVPIFCICSCAHYKDVPYFQNSAEFDGSKGAMQYDLKIKPKDILTIYVFSGNDVKAVAPFNMLDSRVADFSQGIPRVSSSRIGQIHHYLVDNNGNIDFPILGKVNVGYMTIDSINSHIRSLIMPYLQPDADCVVNTYIDNYEITVMGEVNNPNTFTISRPEINVLEALAMAGDMTIYGKRNNVKILRELADGTYEVHELDMRDANILNSPYYYLQQRDVVYVEPNEAMAQNSKIGQTRQLWLRGASITISLGSLLYRVLQ